MKPADQQSFYKALGARVRQLRGPMSQEQLAQRVGLTRTSIVNIEAGRQKLLVHHLFAIADAVGIRPTKVLSPFEPEELALPSLQMNGRLAEPLQQWLQRSVHRAGRVIISE